MQFYNKLNAKEQSDLIDKSGKNRIVLSFYKYSVIGNPKIFRNYLYVKLSAIDVLGRIYTANEGINAQISIPLENLPFLRNELDKITFLKNIRLNYALESENKSFLKLTIKVKDKIVADGLESQKIDLSKRGTYVNALEFNKLLEERDTICIDMRNHYESEVGHFKNAITPDVDTFRESLPLIEKTFFNKKSSKNFLLYCTGGIRCEKASAYFKEKGFKKVFQMQGGIIEYAKQIREMKLENKFKGLNFVFDERKGERISEDVISNCHLCNSSCDSHANCANPACNLLFIQCPDCSKAYSGCCSKDCQTVINLPEEEQKTLRKSKRNSHKVFKKGRSKALKYKT
tara:strand:+ start:1866 stop:2897 length:1032 start_codon:yes stop_codon:yes gene_type:complete